MAYKLEISICLQGTQRSWPHRTTTHPRCAVASVHVISVSSGCSQLPLKQRPRWRNIRVAISSGYAPSGCNQAIALPLGNHNREYSLQSDRLDSQAPSSDLHLTGRR